MENHKYAYASLDDVIFEGRNRAYGAYVLRKIYNENLGKGLAMAIAAFLLFLSIPLVINKFWPQEFVLQNAVKEEPHVLEVIFDTEIATPKTAGTDPEPAEPPRATAANTIATKIVDKPTDKPAETNTATPSDAEPGDGNITAGTGTSTDTGNGSGTGTETVIEAPVAPEIRNFADKMPEFPGGEAALTKFLSSKMRYPESAKRMGVEGLVVATFVVNQEGGISDIKILKNLGAGTDDEAIRVIKLMPKWTPGSNNGKPVHVRYTLPIRFTLAKQ